MYRHLDLIERYCIAAQLKNGINPAQIARAGGRSGYDASSTDSL